MVPQRARVAARFARVGAAGYDRGVSVSTVAPQQSQESPRPSRGRAALALVAVLLAVALAGVGGYFLGQPKDDTDPNLHQRATPSLLLATRDLSRLQTSEMHVEKVIDLTDQQSTFFGLLDGTDNVLLVAVGDVTMGVDLGKLAEGDVTLDEAHAAHFRLPAPEVFSSRLDAHGTYVYSRTTSVFARRNEQLESKARQKAEDAIQKAADTPEARDRAKRQAEKVLRELATSLGATSVTFEWH